MGASAGLHQRSNGNEDDDEVVSGWQPASPPPLPGWLASTFTTLNKKHPLRLLLPHASAAPHPAEQSKVPNSKAAHSRTEDDDVFAFHAPDENDPPPLEQNALPVLLQSPFSRATNNPAQSPLLSRAVVTPALYIAPDAPFSTPGPAPPSQCSMPPPPLFDEEQVSQAVQRATSRPPSSMYRPPSSVHRPTSRLSSHLLPRAVPQAAQRSESPNWLHSPPGSAYPASILQRSPPRRDLPPTASDLRVRYAPTPELLRARRVPTAVPLSPTPSRLPASRPPDEDREDYAKMIYSADPACADYMLPAGRAADGDNTFEAPNDPYYPGKNGALDAFVDAHACTDIEGDMYALYDDANTTLTASDPVVTPFALENGGEVNSRHQLPADEYCFEEHDDTLVDDGNTSGDTTDCKLNNIEDNIPDVFSTPGLGHYVYFDAPTSDPSEEDDYAVVSADAAEPTAFETTGRDVEGAGRDFAATNENNTMANENDEAPIDYGQLGVDYDALDFSWKPFDRKGVSRDRRDPGRSQERLVLARDSPPRGSVRRQSESAHRQPSSAHRQPSSVHCQPSSAHRQLQYRPASQASQPRFLGSVIHAAYGTRIETAPRQAAAQEAVVLPFPLTSSQRAPVTPVRASRPVIQVPQAGSESTLSPVREEDEGGTSLLGALDSLQEDRKKENEPRDDVSAEKTPGPAFAPAPGIYLSPLRGDATSGSQQSNEGDKVEASLAIACSSPAFNESLTSSYPDPCKACLSAHSAEEGAWHWQCAFRQGCASNHRAT
ncbi:uncharacterized protein SCHCODRAFT_02635275 [Schizophyllum commune H4-8]|nr:uncharacterized protein SCHCODRAFT_02635275 [Schizophyllum commune H4-8]KAI5889671.1 hypothetical protein SCHCODRAFT_02635275 [Schizophyllum commune H4-8]